MSLALKSFMKANFDFSGLKKLGVFAKEIKHTDYEAQAKIICEFFQLESIYDYGKHEIRCHISYAGERPMNVDKDGQLKIEPFVSVAFPNSMHI